MGKSWRKKFRKYGRTTLAALAAPITLGASVYYLNEYDKKKAAEEAKQKGLAIGEGEGSREQMDAERGELEKQYASLPQMLRDSYTGSARKAGTYADTPEWQKGLSSEVQAGARGARVPLTARIQALRRALGMAEFTDSGNTEGVTLQNNLNQLAPYQDSITPTAPPIGTTATPAASDDDVDQKTTEATPEDSASLNNAITSLKRKRKIGPTNWGR